jgi:hypothetical protein
VSPTLPRFADNAEVLGAAIGIEEGIRLPEPGAAQVLVSFQTDLVLAELRQAGLPACSPPATRCGLRVFPEVVALEFGALGHSTAAEGQLPPCRSAFAAQ